MYTITIKKLTREEVKKREYRQTGTNADGKAKYDYVDEKATEDVTREVYSQIVEDLDLVKVINAVNLVNTHQTKPPVVATRGGLK